jgi:N-acetylglucosaminyldiphosphoundecaprenol N-acetyl-beta-D-mannosaminyltransferase
VTSTTAGACRIFGIDCFVGDLAEATRLVVERARSEQGGYAVLMNVHVAMTAERDGRLGHAVRDAWQVLPDGAPIAWLERRRGAARAHRIGGPDLMLAVLRSGDLRLRHFLFGSTPDVVDKLERRLSALVPRLRLAGVLAPEAGHQDDDTVIEQIHLAAPDIVWVALGAPKQELWAQRHSASLAPALVVPVGAAFEFHAGTKRRAPEWMQRAGLEWAYRLALEPRRLGWRYLTTNSRFLITALRPEGRDAET